MGDFTRASGASLADMLTELYAYQVAVTTKASPNALHLSNGAIIVHDNKTYIEWTMP